MADESVKQNNQKEHNTMSVSRAVKETVSKALKETGAALKYAAGEEVSFIKKYFIPMREKMDDWKLISYFIH